MKISSKWRPSLALVVASAMGVVICLPLLSFLYFNFYGKQLVQQTEEALIGQAAVMAAIYAREFERAGGDPRLGPIRPADARPDPEKRYHPIFPSLSLEYDAILPRRLDGQPSIRPPMPLYAGIGEALSEVAVEAQLSTLAGFRAIDPFGQVIGGSGEIGYSLAHVPEVGRALEGYPITLLRQRISDEPDPPIWSISRSTNFRVFVALPVVVNSRVVGAIYVSRTPGNVVQSMYQERGNLALAGLSIVAATILIAFLFLRFITTPLYGLIEQTKRASQSDPTPLEPLRHYGTREVAKLGQSFLTMTDTLKERTKSIQTFTNHVTHELKSPLTSIVGATELLNDPDTQLTDQAKAKFIGNMAQDAQRMTLLLDRLSQLASAKEPLVKGRTDLTSSAQEIADRFPDLTIQWSPDQGEVPMQKESLTMVLTHLVENSAAHGAQTVTINLDRAILSVQDDGRGISQQNSARIFDPFFTTRRETGGTGMGLGIAEALVTSAGGTIKLGETQTGARIEIHF